MSMHAELGTLVALGDEAAELVAELSRDPLSEDEREQIKAATREHQRVCNESYERLRAAESTIRQQALERESGTRSIIGLRLEAIRVEIDRVLPGRATSRARLEALVRNLERAERALRK